MFKIMNILVTAVGSELAFAVIKAIKLIKQPHTLHGCDIYKEVAGKYWCDKFYNVPLAKDEDIYIKSLKDIVVKNKIQIIIPTADIEFFILSKYKKQFEKEFNCFILVQDVDEINRFNDKWLAYQWYVEHGLPTPKTYLAEKLDLLEKELSGSKYPMIIKPRQGGGSRTIFTVKNFTDIKKYHPVVPKPIIQEYLYPDDAEYTAGTYRTNSNEVFVIIMKRTLKFGMTNTAETVFNKDMETFVKQVISNTNLTGSNNIQFRLTHEGPKILEINSRFSGTVGIRAHFGFNDVEMWVNEVLYNEVPVIPAIKSGFVMRFMEEQYHISI
jgi:carbamoyl-phosphate synthase large subunit